jgi:hypothetical protein
MNKILHAESVARCIYYMQVKMEYTYIRKGKLTMEKLKYNNPVCHKVVVFFFR